MPPLPAAPLRTEQVTFAGFGFYLLRFNEPTGSDFARSSGLVHRCGLLPCGTVLRCAVHDVHRATIMVLLGSAMPPVIAFYYCVLLPASWFFATRHPPERTPHRDFLLPQPAPYAITVVPATAAAATMPRHTEQLPYRFAHFTVPHTPQQRSLLPPSPGSPLITHTTHTPAAAFFAFRQRFAHAPFTGAV